MSDRLASRVKPRNGNAIAPFDELRNFTEYFQTEIIIVFAQDDIIQ